VTSQPDVSPILPGASANRSPVDSPAFETLRRQVADTLLERASDIAARWDRQAQSVALRDEISAQTTRGEPLVVPLIAVVAEALRSEVGSSDSAVLLGLAFGADAYESGASLHHTLKGLDLLAAMILYAIESDLGGVEHSRHGAADGVHVARRVQQAMSLLTVATVKGFTQAIGDGMRDQFRALRHDLRNPLGTIKNVIAMLDDETLSPDAGANARFLAMASRNARSLEALITNRLGDVAALLPNTSTRHVSLRTVACGVRRDLRAESTARNATVVVGTVAHRLSMDAASLELMLFVLLQAALQEGRAGEEIAIDFGEVSGGYTSVEITCAPDRHPIADPAAVTRIAALSLQMGLRVQVGERVVVRVAVQDLAEESAAPSNAVSSMHRQPLQNRTGGSQRDDGKAGAT